MGNGRKSVIQNLDAENLYEVPLMLHKEGLDNLVSARCLGWEMDDTI